MLRKFKRILYVVTPAKLVITIHVEGHLEVVAGEEAPNGEHQLEDSHHAARLMEYIELVARP